MKKKILLLLVILTLTITTGCTKTYKDNSKKSNSDNDYSDYDVDFAETDIENEKGKKYGLGEKFLFGNLELTLDTDYSFTTLENHYSDKNGSTVVKLGVTVKNASVTENNQLNMFEYKIFGSQGTELDNVSAYFHDDEIDYAGELRPGASYHKYFYFLYDGDGAYSMDFDNYSEQVTAEFEIKK